MKYLVTDPCYIIPNKDWGNVCQDLEGRMPYTIKGYGTIIECSNTEFGDGTAHLSHGKDVNVDSGMVCLVELNDNITPTSYEGTAVTDSEEVAKRWYEKALHI